MKEKRTEFRWFSVPEWKKEEQYLRERHKAGWRFTDVTFPGFYHFEACEPEDVIYQLDYNQDGLAHKDEYVQMFQDCGWEYLLDFVGYSYFRKPVSEMCDENEEIFCDDLSRLDMIRRTFKGRVLPLVVLFCCIIVPQLLMQFNLDRMINKVLFGCYIVLFVVYLLLFMQFGYQYWKLKKRTGINRYSIGRKGR